MYFTSTLFMIQHNGGIEIDGRTFFDEDRSIDH